MKMYLNGEEITTLKLKDIFDTLLDLSDSYEELIIDKIDAEGNIYFIIVQHFDW